MITMKRKIITAQLRAAELAVVLAHIARNIDHRPDALQAVDADAIEALLRQIDEARQEADAINREITETCV